jgi:hypothetical protein
MIQQKNEYHAAPNLPPILLLQAIAPGTGTLPFKRFFSKRSASY